MSPLRHDRRGRGPVVRESGVPGCERRETSASGGSQVKCLSLWQPWASLLAHGLKTVETRGWYMHHRGPLLIHAAKKWDNELAGMCREEPFRSALARIGVDVGASRGSKGWGLPFGAIVGEVRVVGCRPTEQVAPGSCDLTYAHVPPARPQLFLTSDDRAFGDFRPGRFATLCVGAKPLSHPITCRGMQGMWDVQLPEAASGARPAVESQANGERS
jgi:hypothetical protein